LVNSLKYLSGENSFCSLINLKGLNFVREKNIFTGENYSHSKGFTFLTHNIEVLYFHFCFDAYFFLSQWPLFIHAKRHACEQACCSSTSLFRLFSHVVLDIKIKYFFKNRNRSKLLAESRPGRSL
jgi:hypothetical protein